MSKKLLYWTFRGSKGLRLCARRLLLCGMGERGQSPIVPIFAYLWPWGNLRAVNRCLVLGTQAMLYNLRFFYQTPALTFTISLR